MQITKVQTNLPFHSLTSTSLVSYLISINTTYTTVKPVIRDHTKIVLKTSDSLVQVKRIAECSSGVEHSAILLTYIERLSVLKTYFWSFLSDCFRQVLLYIQNIKVLGTLSRQADKMSQTLKRGFS